MVAAHEELRLAKRLQRDVSAAAADARVNAAELLVSARKRLSYLDVSDGEIAEIERTGVVRKALTIRASGGGFVLEKNVLPGQKVMAGDALYKVADLSTAWAEGEVFEHDLAGVRVGQVVHADFQALPATNRAGRISYIYPTLSPDTRTVKIRVVLPNADFKLKPGMYATIRVAGAQHAAALTVPRSGVLSTGERSIVFVRDASGRLAPREVALGASNDERVLPILHGNGTGASVMKRIAAPMVGGMVSSTILTLVVIPAVYSLWKERQLAASADQREFAYILSPASAG